MKQDLSLLERLHHGLCQAVERNGAICFGKIIAKGYCEKHYCRLKRLGAVDLPIKKIKKCKFIDCHNIYFCKGYCEKHYPRKIKKSKVICSIDGCDNSQHGYGLCTTHQLRLKKHGDVNTVLKSGFDKGYTPPWTGSALHKKCIVPGCNVKHGDQKRNLIKGLCNKHYLRWRRHGDYNIILINRVNNKTGG